MLDFWERIELLKDWDIKVCPHCGNLYDWGERKPTFHHVLPVVVREVVVCGDLKHLGYCICHRCHRDLHGINGSSPEPIISDKHISKPVCPPGGFLPKICGTKQYCVSCCAYPLGDTPEGRRAMNLELSQGRCPSVVEKKV